MSPRTRRASPVVAGFVACFVVCSLLAALLVPASAEAAGNEEIELKARTHFAAGEYKEALEIYARLYAETLHPTYLRNIARCHQNLGDADRAITSFREYLRKARDLTPEQRAEVEGYIAEMEELKRRRAAGAAPPPEPTAPTAAAPPSPAPAPPSATPVLVGPPTVTAGRTEEQEPRPIYTRWWFWAAVGGVAAGGVVAALLLGGGDPGHGSLGAFDLRDKTR